MVSQPDPHVAVTEMWLIVNGQSIGLSHVGPDFVILESHVSSTATKGLVVLVVNGERQTYPVSFPQGLISGTKRVLIAEVVNKDLVAA